MFIKKRAIFYLLAVCLLILIFQGLFTPWGAFAVGNLCILILVFVDLRLTPTAGDLRTGRVLDEKLSLGVENRITLWVENRSAIRMRLTLRDEYPEGFRVTQDRLRYDLNPGERGECHYDVIPIHRGKYRFGAVHVRIDPVVGILGRQFKVDLSEEIKVYPNIKNISRYEISARKGRLLDSGLKPVRVYGIGTEFESLREYQPDDEFRKINWKATARRSRLVTSQFQNERSQNIFIVIESGRMMMGRAGELTKFDYALNSAILLSHVAMEKGDNVGIMVFDVDVNVFLPCKRGRRHLHRIIESLYEQEPEMVEPDYGRAIRHLSMKNKKRSLIVLFTDLIDTDVSRSLVAYSRTLYPRHLPLCVAVRDPSLYGEAVCPLETRLDIYRRAVAEDLLFQREQVKAVLERGGVRTLDVSPENLTPALISRYLSIKARSQL